MKLVTKVVVTLSILAPTPAFAQPQSVYASGVAKFGLCETIAASNAAHWTPCFWLWY